MRKVSRCAVSLLGLIEHPQARRALEDVLLSQKPSGNTQKYLGRNFTYFKEFVGSQMTRFSCAMLGLPFVARRISACVRGFTRRGFFFLAPHRLSVAVIGETGNIRKNDQNNQ